MAINFNLNAVGGHTVHFSQNEKEPEVLALIRIDDTENECGCLITKTQAAALAAKLTEWVDGGVWTIGMDGFKGPKKHKWRETKIGNTIRLEWFKPTEVSE